MESGSLPGYNGRKIAFELDSHPSGRLVIFAHGFTSDRNWRGRARSVQARLQRSGIGTLLFDFGGAGASEDAPIRIPHQVDDLRAVFRLARQRGDRVGVWGHSLGSRVTLQARLDGVGALVLSGAGTGPVDYDWKAYFSPEQWRALEQSGVVELPVEHDGRSAIEVTWATLADFADCNQDQLVRPISCPVLLIHGDADDEERRLAAISKAGLTKIHAVSELVVLGGASHSFVGMIDELAEHVTMWFEKFLATNG